MIKADVVYDKNQFAKFIKFSIVDRPLKWIVYLIGTILVTVALILNIGNNYMPMYLVAAILIGLADLIVLFSYFLYPIIKLKNFSEEQVISNHFEFGENEIRFSSESKMANGTAKLSYQQIHSVKESKTCIYIYVARRKAMIIDKSSITEGSVSDLKTLLRQKVPDARNRLGK